eukprot:COSAG05_NODE_22573_length_264_cov_0.606061_1_plen_62_part_10
MLASPPRLFSVAQFRREFLSYTTDRLPVSRHASHTALILPQNGFWYHASHAHSMLSWGNSTT